MLEIPYTFRRIEHANVRPDASLEPFDCALRSFAQECPQGREHRLDWVKLRRILRQIAEACTTTPDRLLLWGSPAPLAIVGGLVANAQSVRNGSHPPLPRTSWHGQSTGEGPKNDASFLQ